MSKMNKDKRNDKNVADLEVLVNAASRKWTSALEKAWPANLGTPGGPETKGCAERNITAYLNAEALNSGWSIYCESPILDQRGPNAKIDAILARKDKLVLVEAKRIYALSDLLSIVRDVNRICDHHPDIHKLLTSFAINGKKPIQNYASFYWLAICELWDQDNKDLRKKFWESKGTDGSALRKWPLANLRDPKGENWKKGIDAMANAVWGVTESIFKDEQIGTKTLWTTH